MTFFGTYAPRYLSSGREEYAKFPPRIHLAGTVDAAGNPLESNVTRMAYPAANVTVSTGASWDDGILSSFDQFHFSRI